MLFPLVPHGTVSAVSSVRTIVDVDDAELDDWRAPRTDLVIECDPSIDDDGFAVYGLDQGPCTRYERRVLVEPLGGDRHRVTQQVDFQLGLGPWSVLFRGPMKARFRRPGGRSPWWAPPQVLDAQGAASLASLAYLALVSGYLGTLITQTITYASDEFDATSRVQGDTLAAVRIGVLLSLGIAAWADRHGRRRALLWCAAAGCAFAALGALAPGMIALGLSQTMARGLSTALGLLIVVVAAEEMPAGSRAYAASLLTMAAGLGAGMVLWVLPIVDLDERAWRLLYVLPLLFLPLVHRTARLLPESRRFVRAHGDATFAGHGRRLVLLAATALLTAAFATPASQLQNEFLREEYSFSAARITAFTILTVTPASIGIVIGGRLADTRGKRLVGGLGLGLGAALTAVQFAASTETLVWVASTVGSVVAGLAVPALAVYGPELFPTALRTKANVIITILGVTGSAIGLVVAGRLADAWDLGPAIAVLAVAPIAAAALLIPLYPETARKELEELNPEDALSATATGGLPTL